MARRRRLVPPDANELETIRAAAEEAERRPVASVLGQPPIARISADVMAAQHQEIEALKAQAAAASDAIVRLADIDRNGLAIIEAPLDAIDVDYLSRDRIAAGAEDEDFRALKSSIQMHGQRMPLDVAPLGGAPGRYGLISGFRRLTVLQRLLEETGDARWSRVRVLVRAPATLGQAFVGMVEENEVRQNLSYFERGRICLRSVEQGAFTDVETALDALFAASSPAKRSKIRSFVRLVEELGDLLRYPQMLGERLGLQVVRALRDGHGGALRHMLGGQSIWPEGPEAEQALLRRCLGQLRQRVSPPVRATRSATTAAGARVEMTATRGGAVLRISGGGVDARSLDESFDLLLAVLSRTDRP